jgi:hypothetical protein
VKAMARNSSPFRRSGSVRDQGRIAATRASSSTSNGSGAPSARPRAFASVTALAIALLAVLVLATAAQAATPTVSGTVANPVAPTTAVLRAQVNPEGLETTYRFEYGTDTSYGQSTPETPIGEGNTNQLAAEEIDNLTPETTYHFRIVATNTDGTTEGPDFEFTTLPTDTCPNVAFRTGFGVALPDCRAYEQATPVDKNGTNAEQNLNAVTAAEDGNAVTFGSISGFPPGTAGTSDFYITRRGLEGWSANGLRPNGNVGEYIDVQGWSDDLSASLSWVLKAGSGMLKLLRGDLVSGTWDPMVTVPFISGRAPFLADFAGDTAHLTFEYEDASTPDVVGSGTNLYDIDHGVLRLAGRVPPFPATTCDDAAHSPDCVGAAEGSHAGPYGWQEGGLYGGGATGEYYDENTLSDDGTKVFFTEGGTGRIYMREDHTRTVQVSASQAAVPDPNGHKAAVFHHATPDGSTVFFSSCERLTDDSTAVSTGAFECFGGFGGQGSDLYSYDTATGELTDLTVDTNANPLGADVRGFLGASRDGSILYFVARGVLAAGATAGEPNLYVSEEGTIQFVATFSGTNDQFNWQAYFNRYAGTSKTSVVSDNGTLVITSSAPLTGYDNQAVGPGQCGNGSPGQRCFELYRYQPGGPLNCVSCNPTGPPTGDAALVTDSGFIGFPWHKYLPRNVSKDGQKVFFDTNDNPLLADVNGVRDVYEWEADGSGSCTQTSPSYVSDLAGCLYLLSTGTNPVPAYFGDSSLSGDDVFIFTDSQLVPQDQDELVDVYDVRVGGGMASQHTLSPPPCQGPDQCREQGTHELPPLGAGTAVFQGPGDPAPKFKKCRKGLVKRNGKCVKRKRHHRRANHNRGGQK